MERIVTFDKFNHEQALLRSIGRMVLRGSSPSRRCSDNAQPASSHHKSGRGQKVWKLGRFLDGLG